MSELPYCDCCSHAEASKNGKEVYDIGVFVGAGGAWEVDLLGFAVKRSIKHLVASPWFSNIRQVALRLFRRLFLP